MEAYTPAMLPPITTVEVVDLSGIDADRVDQYMQNAVSAPSVTLQGDAAQRVASLWRALPPGEQSRCHSPPYGFRFRSGERLVCEASVCWKCDNIFGTSEGRPIHFEFDATQPVSQDLLTEARRAIDESTPSASG